MQIPPDALPFVFTHFDNLLLELLRMLEQSNARFRGSMLFFGGDAGHSHKKEKGEPN